MQSPDNVRDILVQRQVLLEGHFLLTSGKHSQFYFEKFRILQHPSDAQLFCQIIAEQFRGTAVDAVVGPTTGGIIIAFQVASMLGATAIYAERTAGGRGFRRGMSLSPGQKVLVVDDVLTTGGSVRETIDAVKRSQAELVGVAVFIDRSTARPEYGVPFHAVHREEVVAYEPEACPLCRQGLPLVKPGSSPAK